MEHIKDQSTALMVNKQTLQNFCVSADPARLIYMVCHFVAEVAVVPSGFHFVIKPQTLTLAARKFHNWICCTGGLTDALDGPTLTMNGQDLFTFQRNSIQ